MEQRPRRPRHWTVLARSVFTIALLVRLWYARGEQSHDYGRFTEQQILDRSAALCRTAAPEAGDLNLSLYRGLTHGSVRHDWCGVAQDSHGRDVVTLTLYADTGELCALGHVLASDPRHGVQVPFSRAEALAAGQHWLGVLGIGRRDLRLRFARAPERGSRLWAISWQAGDRGVTIVLEDCSGALATAQSCPRRSDSSIDYSERK